MESGFQIFLCCYLILTSMITLTANSVAWRRALNTKVHLLSVTELYSVRWLKTSLLYHPHRSLHLDHLNEILSTTWISFMYVIFSGKERIGRDGMYVEEFLWGVSCSARIWYIILEISLFVYVIFFLYRLCTLTATSTLINFIWIWM